MVVEMENMSYKLRKQRSETMLNQGLEPVKDGFNEYWIPSQNDKNKRYRVTIENDWYSCGCPDNKKGNLCKHILLLKTYLAIRLSSKKINGAISVSNPCPYCESMDVHKDGTRKTIMGKKQKWLCKDCGKRFVNDPITKIKGNTDTVIMAIDLYMKGVSYRGIADSLNQFYGLKITHVTVMNWVKKYMRMINDYTDSLNPEVGDVWHADEQFIKVKGKQEYVWNVLDGKTRFLLVSNPTPTRNVKDARATFQKAKKIAQKKAKTVVTDGSFNYSNSVKKEFATYKNPKPHKRYVSLRSKDSSNNNIERFHSTFRQRDKVMRGFDGNQKQHAENFRTYYNFIKNHMGLGMTPAQKAKLSQKPEWKDLLIKAINQPKLNSQNLTNEN